jgi:hypothetical protein
VDLAQTEELENLAGLGGNAVDTKQCDRLDGLGLFKSSNHKNK